MYIYLCVIYVMQKSRKLVGTVSPPVNGWQSVYYRVNLPQITMVMKLVPYFNTFSDTSHDKLDSVSQRPQTSVKFMIIIWILDPDRGRGP